MNEGTQDERLLESISRLEGNDRTRPGSAGKDAGEWEVRPGDRFLPYAVTIWMNEHDHGFNYRVLDNTATSLARAIKRGLALNGSDDFNIAAIRGGRMVAALWMDEVVDDEPDVIERIADALGLTSVLTPALGGDDE